MANHLLAHKRIRKDKRPGYLYVGRATLKPLESAQARNGGGARAQSLVLPKEQVTVKNRGRVATLV